MTTKSMTAFARVETDAFVWELRSVNHRYLDTSFNLPDNFRHLESGLRAQFRDRVFRGRVDCLLKIAGTDASADLAINEALVGQLKAALVRVEALTGLAGNTDAMQLLRWPGVVADWQASDALSERIVQGFSAAVDLLLATRQTEGAELAGLMESKRSGAEAIVEALRQGAPGIRASQEEKLRARLAEMGVKPDPTRLEAELVILAQKQDIAEELDRLGAHLQEVKRTLAQQGPVGRRLDFLMQELNREANTLSAKSAVATATLHAVDLKVLIEQMREQAQNIE